MKFSDVDIVVSMSVICFSMSLCCLLGQLVGRYFIRFFPQFSPIFSIFVSESIYPIC